MRRPSFSLVIVSGLVGLGALAFMQSTEPTPPPSSQPAPTSSANAARAVAKTASKGLHKVYTRWAKAYAKSNPPGPVLALSWNRALSVAHTKAKGIAQIDLGARTLSLRVQGLSDPLLREVWLVDNQPGDGRSELPEPGDKLVHVGQLIPGKDGEAWLDATVPELATMRLDSLVVAGPGEDPGKSGVLYGTTSLFQKMFHYAPEKALDSGKGLLPKAHARGFSPMGYFEDLDSALVLEGRRLFFNETFAGNGRTCGTCHREDDNLALTMRTIAKLPADDPLFIVEQRTLADGSPNALYGDSRMEKPALMRSLGLILENLDGFREPDGTPTKRAVMRAPSHVLSMRTTVAPPPPVSDDGTLPQSASQLRFAQRTGWSGDGSPSGFNADFFRSAGRELTGSLRDFTVGAVIQHFPRTLERSAASESERGSRTPDFRLPTERELDALEAFMLSSGVRGTRPSLADLTLQDPIAERGRRNYMGFNIIDTDPQDGRPPLNCQACHRDGGAMTDPSFPFPPSVSPNHDLDDLEANDGMIISHNRSFAPGVERLADQPADIVMQTSDSFSARGDCKIEQLAEIPLLPGDNPSTPSLGCATNPFDNGFQNTFERPFLEDQITRDRFNVPPVFEALDNPPFFHGHQIDTIEGMVSFYATNRHFRNGEQAGAIVPLNASQVVNVARFLRVMGADFNLEAAASLLIKSAAFASNQPDPARYNAYLARTEIEDAIQLLDAGNVHFADVIPQLEDAMDRVDAMVSGQARARHRALRGRSKSPWGHRKGERPQEPEPEPAPATASSALSVDAIGEVIGQIRAAQRSMIQRPDPQPQDAMTILRYSRLAGGSQVEIDPHTRAILDRL